MNGRVNAFNTRHEHEKSIHSLYDFALSCSLCLRLRSGCGGAGGGQPGEGIWPPDGESDLRGGTNRDENREVLLETI
jgi:hypothetical protein